MDTIKMSVDTFDNNVDSVLYNYMEKPTLVKGVVHLLLMLYVARIAPIPPKIVLDLFSNIYFKLFIFSLVLWTAQVSPSTSILIALAFLVTVNYTTTGKVWEMLDNVSDDAPTTITLEQSAEAIDLLAQAAASNTSSDVTTVQTVANIAVANATTPEAVASIQTLAQQAVVPEAGDTVKVAEAVAVAKSMPTMPTMPEMPEMPTIEQSAEAVDLLAQAAVSKSSSDVATVQTVANIAAANVSTPDAIAAITALAQQAISPDAGASVKVAEAVTVAKSEIVGAGNTLFPEQELAKVSMSPIVLPTVTPQETGCYPIRKIDMSAVMGMINNSYEDHATFVSK
jgi:hypothetical protein